MVGIAATLVSMLIGTLVGIAAGHFSGWVGGLLMRIIDFFLVLPSLILAIVLSSVLSRGVLTIIIAIGAHLVGRHGTCREGADADGRSRVTTSTVLKPLAPATGTSSSSTCFPASCHWCSPTRPSRSVSAIIAESTLSFLGLGDTTQQSWGTILKNSMDISAATSGYWWYVVIPGLAIVFVVLAFTLIGPRGREHSESDAEEPLMPDLTFEDVSISYSTSGRNDRGEVHAVKNVSLTLPEGGTLGIAGESGSGKSTLAMSVLRLLPKNAKITGRVAVGDTDISDLSFGKMRALRWAEASIIFQGAMHSLNPVQTVGAQINEALALHVTDKWKTAQLRQDRVKELLTLVDMPADKTASYPHELSGGQKQRVMIAMALACEPDIIIADEPTTALDVIVQKQILDMIAKLVSERGISMLMISHDLSVLATACDRDRDHALRRGHRGR